MGCPPVRKIIHSLKLVDYLHVQADNPGYNYYLSHRRAVKTQASAFATRKYKVWMYMKPQHGGLFNVDFCAYAISAISHVLAHLRYLIIFNKKYGPHQ